MACAVFHPYKLIRLLHGMFSPRCPPAQAPALFLQRVTFLEGHPGCLALQIAIASLHGNAAQAQHSLQVRQQCSAALWPPNCLLLVPPGSKKAEAACRRKHLQAIRQKPLLFVSMPADSQQLQSPVATELLVLSLFALVGTACNPVTTSH